MSAPIVGIDLGTSNSVIATVLNGEAVVLPDSEGRRVFPSIVSFPDASAPPVVGQAARGQLLVAPERSIVSAKRLIGRHWFSEAVQAARNISSVPLERGPNDTVLFAARTPALTVEEVQAEVLRHVVEIATAYLGVAPKRAVITVPANFNEAQRQATRLAGELAGLDVLRILNEPTAAALAYGSGTTQRERLAVYDLGGGTFDITLLEVRDNVIEVLSTAGDTFLGGDDVDAALAHLLESSVAEHLGSAPDWAPHSRRRLAVYAEQMKIALGEHERVGIEAEGLLNTGPESIPLRTDRSSFERCILPILQQTFLVCDQAFQLAGLSTAQIDRLILVGGSTRSPVIGRLVESYFGKPSSGDINQDEVVALGAAVFAHAIAGEELPMDLLEELDELEDDSSAPPPIPPARRAPSGPMGAIPPHPSGPSGPHQVEAGSLPEVEVDVPAGSRRSTAPGGHALLREDDDDTLPPPTLPRRISPHQTGPFPIAEAPTVPRQADHVAAAPSPAPAPAPAGVAPPAIASPAAEAADETGETEPFRIQPTDPGASAKAAPVLPRAFDAAPPSTRPPARVGTIRGPEQPRPAERRSVRARRGSVLLIDVVPRALGIQTAGGYTDILIPRNASLPTRTTRRFTTSSDQQQVVRIDVREGEAKRAENNHPLGQLVLAGLPARPRGQVTVEVTFEVTTEGMLHIEAKDLEQGQRQEATLQVSGGHSEEMLRKLREGRT